LRQELEQLESEIADLEEGKQKLEQALNDPEIASDSDRIVEVTREFGEIERNLEAQYTRWSELSEEIETKEREIEAMVTGA
jgi:ATP-binding cassette subfamily F protein 3